MNVPRISATIPLCQVESAIIESFQTLRYQKPTWVQEEAIRSFVMGKDVFVIVPTGSGKSACYVALTLVFDSLRKLKCKTEPHHSIVLVISPLTALMKDQVAKYGHILQCAFIADEKDIQGAYDGSYQLFYSSPESVLGDAQLRDMLCSPVYNENLVAVVIDEAHCIYAW